MNPTLYPGTVFGLVYTKNDYVETESLMSLTVTDMKKNMLVFYDKNTGKHWLVTEDSEIVDDIDMYMKSQFCGIPLPYRPAIIPGDYPS